MQHVLAGCLILVSLAAECEAGRFFRGRLLRNCVTCVAARPTYRFAPESDYTEPIGYQASVQDDSAPEVNEAEVLRLGDMVQHVTTGLQASADSAYIEALGPPESDADKWFISVITTEGCQACVKLKQDFASSPWLQALAHPTDPRQSWAHYNVYAREDASQNWRFEDVQVTAYPTVLVQPPRSGQFGDPQTVVYQGVYSGDPRELAAEITRAIRLYVSKLPVLRAGQEDAIGADPPWRPIRREGDDLLLLPNLKVPPIDVEHEIKFPWTAVVTLLTAGFSIPAIVALVIWLITLVRAKRKSEGKQLLVSDETFQQILEQLQKLTEAAPKPASRARSKR